MERDVPAMLQCIREKSKKSQKERPKVTTTQNNSKNSRGGGGSRANNYSGDDGEDSDSEGEDDSEELQNSQPTFPVNLATEPQIISTSHHISYPNQQSNQSNSNFSHDFNDTHSSNSFQMLPHDSDTNYSFSEYTSAPVSKTAGNNLFHIYFIFILLSLLTIILIILIILIIIKFL